MLTDIALKNLKPETKPYKRSDGGGLFVIVNPNGRKYWRIACRVAGKQKFLSGSSYPEVGLREARNWRAAVKAQLVLGMAPTVQPLTCAKATAQAEGQGTGDTLKRLRSNGTKPVFSVGRRAMQGC